MGWFKIATVIVAPDDDLLDFRFPFPRPFSRTTTPLLHFCVFFFTSEWCFFFCLFISDQNGRFVGFVFFSFTNLLSRLFCSQHHITQPPDVGHYLPFVFVYSSENTDVWRKSRENFPPNYWSFYCVSPDDSARIFPLCILLTMRHCVGLSHENLVFYSFRLE